MEGENAACAQRQAHVKAMGLPENKARSWENYLRPGIFTEWIRRGLVILPTRGGKSTDINWHYARTTSWQFAAEGRQRDNTSCATPTCTPQTPPAACPASEKITTGDHRQPKSALTCAPTPHADFY